MITLKNGLCPHHNAHAAHVWVLTTTRLPCRGLSAAGASFYEDATEETGLEFEHYNGDHKVKMVTGCPKCHAKLLSFFGKD